MLPLFLLISLLHGAGGKCPVGAVQGISVGDCYLYRVQPTSWYFAEEDCVRQTGHLVSIHSAFENAFLLGQTCPSGTNSGSADYWTGAGYNVANDERWSWTDGSSFRYSNWAGSNFSNTLPVCGSLSVWNAHWYQDDCNAGKPYICKVQVVAIPTLQPVTCPAPATCSSPPACHPPACEDGWTYYPFANMCYKLIDNGGFYDSLSQCQSFGGTLASVHGIAQNWFLVELASTHGDPELHTWMGLYKSSSTDDAWHWTDGSTVDFGYWMAGQPDGNGRFASLQPITPKFSGWDREGGWDDEPCVDRNTAICQKPTYR